MKWSQPRPEAMVIACSDGRLQEATDAFLKQRFSVIHYDRFYVPGGGGALTSSGSDIVRAQQMRRECHYLIDLHGVKRVIALFHGPAPSGPTDAMCADYRRKLPHASIDALRERQVHDARELFQRREEWAGTAEVLIYRCEVSADHSLNFVDLMRNDSLG